MSRVYLLKYNNYYNRIYKKFDLIGQYESYLVKYNGNDVDKYGNHNVMEDVNFAPKDGVNTTLVCNWVGEVPDYLLVTDLVTETIENDDGQQQDIQTEVINSRWFVTNFDEQNYTQKSLILYRDLLVDHMEEIQDQPIFIEKGTPTDLDDPAIFNSEDMSFNQIKKEETFIKDSTGCAWIVGFMPRDYSGKNDIQVAYTQDNIANYEEDKLSDWKYYSYVSTAGKGKQTDANKHYYRINSGTLSAKLFGVCNSSQTTWDVTGVTNKLSWADATVSLNINETTNNSINNTGIGTIKASKYWEKEGNYPGSLKAGSKNAWYMSYRRSTFVVFGYKDERKFVGAMGKITSNSTSVSLTPIMKALTKSAFYMDNRSKLYAGVNIDTANMISNSDHEQLISLNNKVLHIKTSATGEKYYLIHVESVSETKKGTIPGGKLDDVYRFEYTADISSEGPETYYDNFIGIGTFDVDASLNMQYDYIWLEDISGEIMYDIPTADNRYHLKDQPYDMFCIPYPIEGDFYINYKDEDGETQTIKDIDAKAGLLAATALGAAIGSANVTDLQLLPYCPISGIMLSGGIDCTTYGHTWINRSIKGERSDEILNVILFATQSDFSLTIPFTIEEGKTVEEKKVRSATEVWRLSSPNYAGLYEFNPQMNGGVESLHVDCTYKPFSPYIHVHPNYGDYYGKSFEDARGLICGGDFSLPLVSDAWTEYQYNNKNYQEIFDRGIQNQETNNAYQRTMEQAEYKLGNFEAYIAGRQYGSETALGLGSLFGQEKKWGNKYQSMAEEAGKVDLEMNNALRQEALDYTKDMFGYQMGNIQALSQSLVKVSAFTKSNKLWPFIERYGCDLDDQTVQEDAFKNKLKYNGYTIMRIDKLSNFINVPGSYIKGQLIRLPEKFDAEYHIGVALTRELDKGFYVSEEDVV